jgi:hypothetical protein
LLTESVLNYDPVIVSADYDWMVLKGHRIEYKYLRLKLCTKHC